MSVTTRNFEHPFIPGELSARKVAARVIAERGRSQSASSDAVVNVAMMFAVIGVIVGSLVCLGQGWWMPFGWLPSVALCGFVGLVLLRERRVAARAEADLLAVRKEIDRHWTVRAPKSVAAPVAAVINGIRALPAEQRREFEPVMEAVTDACEVLRRDPLNLEARDRILARAEAVTEAVAQVRALEEEMRRQEVALTSRTSGDADLLLVQAFTEAVTEARASVARASAPAQLPC